MANFYNFMLQIWHIIFETRKIEELQ